MANTNIEAILPLNAVQDGVLYHTLYASGSSLYIQQYVGTVKGLLDADRFMAAWDVVIGRHQAMRSFITWDEREQPLQLVRGSVRPEWLREDWSAASPAEQEQRLAQWLEDDRSRGFTLDVAPLMRFALVRMGPESHCFVWTHHHIVLDGWSLGIVLNEVFTVYEAGDGASLPEPASLRSHAAWYRQQDWSASEGFWRSVVADVEAGTRLGIEAMATQPWAHRQVEAVHRLDGRLSQRIRDLAQETGVSLSSVFRAAWAILLSRYADERDVVFGAAVAGRPPELTGALDMVGMFINSIPVRIDVDPEVVVSELLKRVQTDQMASQAFESTPLSQIQSWSGVEGEEALFHSLLVFENVPRALPAGAGVEVVGARYLQESNYPISILVMPAEELAVHLLFDPDRYTRETIDRLLFQLERTLAAMAADPETRLRDVESLTEDDLAEVAAAPAVLDPGLAPPTTIHQLIVDRSQSVVSQRPAIVSGDVLVTYAQLDERSAAVAGELRRRGIGVGDLVAIASHRSPGTVIAMLGALRAGAGYVPVDPDMPADRLSFVLSDAGARFLIADTTPHPDGADRLAVDSEGRLEGAALETAPDGPDAKPDDVAYVMYTSGSTGQPKGVIVTHRNLVSSTLARWPVYEAGPEAFLVVSPLFFDSSVAGIYSTLVEGGTVVFPEPAMEQDVLHLAGLIDRHGVTHTLMVPSLYGLLLEHASPDLLESLDTVMVAGESCPASLIAAHHQVLSETRLFNEYGPTEATVWCTVAELKSSDAEEPVTIGAPIPGTDVYLLDRLLRPSPPGAFGELCIAGPGVAKGYLGRPELTEDRFVDLALTSGSSVRAYRSGDIARRRPDGLLELAGRRDHQVKIRGQRVELGEIEAVLKTHPDVREAVALVHAEEGKKPTGVIAYVEPATVDATGLRHYAADRLARVMVPGTIVALESLPRGATGKVDRRPLEARDVEQAPAAGVFVAPATDTERALAEIWAAVLGVDAVGVNDNFFDLGGDSILTIRIIARAHESGLSITPRQFFDHPTIAELARAVTAEG